MRRINCLIVALALLACCTTINTKTIRRLSPEWWDLAEARYKNYPGMNIQIIFNDSQIGWLYNNGERFTDIEFMEYAKKYVPEGAEIKFFYGINRHNKKYIRLGVIYYEVSKH